MDAHSSEKRLGYLSVLVIAIIGIGGIVVSFKSGNNDLRTELPYDLGIACLLIAGIELGLLRGLARMSLIWGEFREIREFKTKFQQRDVKDALQEAKEALHDLQNHPLTTPEMQQKIQERLADLETLSRRMDESNDRDKELGL